MVQAFIDLDIISNSLMHVRVNIHMTLPPLSGADSVRFERLLTSELVPDAAAQPTFAQRARSPSKATRALPLEL